MRGARWVTCRGVEGSPTHRPSTLDAMLEDDGAGPFEPDSRLEELCRSLEEKNQKKPEGREGASAVLARRVQASAESTKKCKNDYEQDKVKKAVKTLA